VNNNLKRVTVVSILTIVIVAMPLFSTIFLVGFYAGWYAAKNYPGGKNDE